MDSFLGAGQAERAGLRPWKGAGTTKALISSTFIHFSNSVRPFSHDAKKYPT